MLRKISIYQYVFEISRYVMIQKLILIVSNPNKIKKILEILMTYISIRNQSIWLNFVVKLTVNFIRVFLLIAVVIKAKATLRAAFGNHW